jgi:hypothetical protein
MPNFQAAVKHLKSLTRRLQDMNVGELMPWHELFSVLLSVLSRSFCRFLVCRIKETHEEQQLKLFTA